MLTVFGEIVILGLLSHSIPGAEPELRAPRSSHRSLIISKKPCSQAQLILVLSAIGPPGARAAEQPVLVAHSEEPGGLLSA